MEGYLLPAHLEILGRLVLLLNRYRRFLDESYAPVRNSFVFTPNAQSMDLHIEAINSVSSENQSYTPDFGPIPYLVRPPLL